MARVIHRDRTSGFLEFDVRDGEGALVARPSFTCVLLSGDRAALLFALTN